MNTAPNSYMQFDWSVILGVGQDIKQNYLWYPLFQAQCYRCYNLEHVDDISFGEITLIILESNVEIVL
jgi:hypothetical protein